MEIRLLEYALEIPPILKIYQEQYPNVTIRLIEESTDTLIDLTARGFNRNL